MGVREKLHAFPQLTAAVAAIAVIGSLAFVYFNTGGNAPVDGRPDNFFLTADDGKTVFVGPADPLPPFKRDGQTVYRACMFTCDGGQTKFVGYLERYSDHAKAIILESWKRQEQSGRPPGMDKDLLAGIEIKKPGDTTWVPQSDIERAARILDVRCTEPPFAKAEMVFP